MFKISWFCGSGLKRFFSYSSITCGRILDFSSSVSKNRPCRTTFRKGQKKFEASFLVKNASKDRFKKHFEFFWTFLVILAMKEASNRFWTFIESCSAWSIFGYGAWKIQNPSTGYEVRVKKRLNNFKTFFGQKWLKKFFWRGGRGGNKFDFLVLVYLWRVSNSPLNCWMLSFQKKIDKIFWGGARGEGKSLGGFLRFSW